MASGIKSISTYILRLSKAPVIWTFMVTILRTGGFFLVLPITLRTIPAAELGLWYIFLSIAQLASILEMGFSPTIGRFASYFMGGAKEIRGLGTSSQNGEYNSPNYAGLFGLIKTSHWLYQRIAILLGLVMLLCGGTWLYFFYPSYIAQPKNMFAFLFYVLGTTIGMIGYFWPGLLYGINKVQAYQQCFIVGLLLNYAVCVAGLLLNFGLFALAAGQITLGLYSRFSSRKLVRKALPSKAGPIQEVDCRDLWPMTWRTGIGSIAAYFSLPITTLICAQVTDLSTTASYGLSLQLAFMLHGLASSWLLVKYPAISTMRSQGQITEIRALVKKRMMWCVATYIVGAAVACLLGPVALHLLQTKTHFLPTTMLALLFLTVGVDFFVGLHIAIMQTGNQTPYLNSAIVTGILTVSFGYILGSLWGIYALILSPLLAQVCYNLWSVPIRCWRDLCISERFS